MSAGAALRTLVRRAAFSGVIVASAASLLALASMSALGTVNATSALIAVIFGGTFAVYNLDRLRDLQRDRVTCPLRSAFVAHNRTPLMLLSALAAVAAGVNALTLGRPAVLLLAAVAAVGVAHLRIKSIPFAKTLYITASWLAVVVVLPLVTNSAAEPAPSTIAAVAFVLGTALYANALASSARDEEASAARFGERFALRIARAVAGTGVLAALVAPPTVRALLPVPLFTLLALVAFQSEETFGLVVLDGSLLTGAALAIPLAVALAMPAA